MVRRIGVIGLGPMGGAIARALIARGHEVSVWNRTGEVARAVDGAVVADSVSGLIAGVEAVLVSLPSYRISRELLEVEDCEAAMGGKMLVQLSTGGPHQARRQQEWAQSHGAQYLAGSVLGYPRALGADVMSILYGGSQASFQEWEGTLAELAPGQLFVGDDPGAPASMSGPLWHFYYGAYGSYLEAAAYADTSGIGLQDFEAAATRMANVLLDGIRDSSDRIREGRLSGEQATIHAIHRDLDAGQLALQEVGIDGLFTGAFITYLGRAIEGGAQDQDPAAAFHHVRRNAAKTD
ncbi:NAD(P)-dependent oxidoreductase [Aeromicrobium sp. CTD01-1L150]|uniref:NAD(P)-dependent oxidoreductase n=1 Tax=Aeromicrobium sp. CTD01-1L150 TaxID=3341830 RepID=UPI0035C14AB8